MRNKAIIKISLAALMLFAITATASAGETLADHDEFNFAAPETKAELAAKQFTYDQGYWQYADALIEDNVTRYNVGNLETKAEKAARKHSYDRANTELVGTEAGNWDYRPGHPEGKTYAETDNSKTHCSKC